MKGRVYKYPSWRLLCGDLHTSPCEGMHRWWLVVSAVPRLGGDAPEEGPKRENRRAGTSSAPQKCWVKSTTLTGRGPATATLRRRPNSLCRVAAPDGQENNGGLDDLYGQGLLLRQADHHSDDQRSAHSNSHLKHFKHNLISSAPARSILVGLGRRSVSATPNPPSMERAGLRWRFVARLSEARTAIL